jgi:hypothetical protein
LAGGGVQESVGGSGGGHSGDATRPAPLRQVLTPPACEAPPRALVSTSWSDGAAFS